MTTEPCPVCKGPTASWASARILGDVSAQYARCDACGLIAAQEVTWLERAYTEAISGLDVGLLDRCVALSHVTAAVLHSQGLRRGRFLDWAGGYGALTRLMRDRGYDFHDLDPMAQNVFAGMHRIAELPPGASYDMITAFEVLEHLTDPVAQLEGPAMSTDLLLVTTQVQPQPPPRPDDWDYFALDSGQHVTLYTQESIRRLAQRLGFRGAVSGPLMHLMYRHPVRRRTAAMVRSHQAAWLVGTALNVSDRRRSLTLQDADDYRRNL